MAVPTRPENASISAFTDKYFSKTKAIVEANGESEVVYAVFMRRPVLFAGRLALDWLNKIASERSIVLDINQRFEEGGWVGAGEPMLYIKGPYSQLVDLETLLLQKLGPACVAAFNAFLMCVELPKVAFLAMDARHCAGEEMAELMAYAASVGSDKAKQERGAVGFVGNATDVTAHYFGQSRGFGTMPHGLIGYAGSTLKAAQLFHDRFPDDPLYVLVDYFGREISDAIDVAKAFPQMAEEGRLGVRIDTHGGRFMEGLDTARSYAVLDSHAPQSIRSYRSEAELRWLTGTGVTAAALFHMREKLDEHGFPRVKIIASSGFGPAKCRLMASVNAPVDIIGTGSYLPEKWSETYATADVISYGGDSKVKIGREFLFPPELDEG